MLRDIIIGMIFPYLYVKRQLKNRLKEHFSTIILLSINHRHADSPMLSYISYTVYIFVCVSVLSLFLSLYIFHSFS